jgi:hypothetical protein
VAPRVQFGRLLERAKTLEGQVFGRMPLDQPA